ncbi:type II secretion system protein [Candidatus Saccharibacteria bacterium]|nr:type II secretion system protein [Candidatus Saccharibacteria bacterium]
MSTNIKKLNKGFTIIEVLIVLAIAGLILAIVFLAVPALQRNSRNTAIRSDAAGVLAAVNDYIANNQGGLPLTTSSPQTGPTICIGTGSGATCPGGASEAKVRGGTSVQFASGGSAAATTTGTIIVRFNVKCNGNNFSGTSAPRAVAAGFLIESTSANTAPQCIES